MRLRDVPAITLSSLAVSHILSAGGVGGWVVTYNALRKRQAPHGLIFVAIAAQQFFNYVVLWFVFALALLWLVIVRGESIAGYVVGIVLIGLILWLTGYGVYLYNRRTRMRRRAQQVAHLVNRVTRRETIQEDHIDGWLDNLLRRHAPHDVAPRRIAHHRSCWPACSGPSTCSACGHVLRLRLHDGVRHLLVGYVVAYAIGTLAPTPGGLGAIEGIMIALYVSFGVPSATAVAVVLVYRLINFWLPIPPGFVAYFVVRPGRHAHRGGRDRGGGREAREMERARDRRRSDAGRTGAAPPRPASASR